MRMSLGVLRDLVENGFQFYCWPPIPDLFPEARVHHEPRDVERPRDRVACYLMRAEVRFAPFAQLRERHRVLRAAAKINGPRVIGIARLKLAFQQRQQIPRVNAIAALMSGAIESDIPQGPPAQPGINPERKDTLLGMAELSGAREHAATIDPDRKLKRLAVLLGDAFGGELGGAIKRYRRSCREILGDAVRANAVGQRHREIGLEGGVGDDDRNFRKRFDRIDPAGAEQSEPGAIALRHLEQIYRAVKIILDELAAARRAVYSREHTRISRRVDYPIDLRERFEVAGGTEISMADDDAAFPQRLDIQLASGPAQIVQPNNFPGGDVVQQATGERASRESAYSGDKDFHGTVLLLATRFDGGNASQIRWHLIGLEGLQVHFDQADEWATVIGPLATAAIDNNADAGDPSAVGADDVDGFLNAAAARDHVLRDDEPFVRPDLETAPENQAASLFLHKDVAFPERTPDFLADNDSAKGRGY